MSIITDETIGKIREQIALRNARLRDFATLYAQNSWQNVQLDVKTLTAAQLATKYPIGTELICNYAVDGVTYQFPWVVLDNARECEWEDGSKHAGLWLGAKYACVEDIQFDATEGETADEATAQEGVYYVGKTGSTYTALNLNTGDTVPYGSYDTVLKGTVQNVGAYQYGYNRWRDSGQRQWLNSAAAAGEWWESTHLGDNPPSQLASRAGFMAGLDTDFLAVITPVKVKTAANTVTDGGVVDTTIDKFFLQSVEEMYGVPQLADAEGPYFPYWKTKTGLDAPNNGNNDGRKIPRVSAPSGSAVTVRCRSSFRSYVIHAWGCYTSGQLNSNYYSYNSYAALPACVIS